MKLKERLRNSIGYLQCKLNHIEHKANIYIGYNVKIINMGGVVCGESVIIRPSSNLYISKGALLKLGDNTEIGNHSTISTCKKVIIGNGVLMGPHVFIADHNHNYLNPNVPIYLQGKMCAVDTEVVIGDGTWIGTNSVIVGKVHVGKNCVIGANSVVNKDIPDYCVAVGIPCKVIKRFNFTTSLWERV